MGHRSARWAWSKVSTIHGVRGGDAVGCAGEISSYRYRLYAPSDKFYERCVGLAWCSNCREYSGAMVFVPRNERLRDLLADLPTAERERLARSEVKLLDYLDRLARQGIWPPRQP
ncbi:hypothetical protein C7C45_07745 [Micromonospora arborensis]|uniref:Uncharacterized protein n=1 Tax=Micromonospora arborensis TaxID=2116518 RepID=A0A318NNS2_9ACTN|nr:hypothetical protein [Micromonospora arborensis]PYC72984.1 hypothetical protein C7C45_07745 [Micromonospora arborensis]